MEPKIEACHGSVIITYGGAQVCVPQQVLVRALADLGLAIQNSGDMCDPALVTIAQLLEQASHYTAA